MNSKKMPFQIYSGIDIDSYQLNFLLEKNEKFFIDYTDVKNPKYLINGLIITAFALLCFFSFHNQTDIYFWYFILFPISIGIFFIILHFNPKPYVIEMNRLKNQISYPYSLLRIRKTCFFHRLKVRKVLLINNEGPGPDYCSLKISNHGFFFRTSISNMFIYPTQEEILNDFWSFIIWYMDKNRPLPPGTAFDPYRQQDFERRRAEGFPKPLYPSSISTPEATKEQQQERSKIGGW